MPSAEIVSDSQGKDDITLIEEKKNAKLCIQATVSLLLKTLLSLLVLQPKLFSTLMPLHLVLTRRRTVRKLNGKACQIMTSKLLLLL